ncbi:hypothetical protein NMG60_11034517 [Bertholletia excelsa]
METGGRCNRSRLSLSDDKVDSPNLRDFLRIREDDGRGLTGLTLMQVLSLEKRSPPTQVNQTLLDIIRDDPNYGSKYSKNSWKAFKAKLRLRRAAAAWPSAGPIPVCDVPVQSSIRIITRRETTGFPPIQSDSENPPSFSTHPEQSSSSTSINEGENRAELNNTTENNAGEAAELHQLVSSAERAENESERGEMVEPPVRMSLMALLEETDRQIGADGPPFMVDGEEDEEEQEVGERRGVECGNCCVCMVRHKGAAFIPCGHTFCRLCSRELWVQRGNCPLCNGFIVEILDIF